MAISIDKLHAWLDGKEDEHMDFQVSKGWISR